jgi:hypothetical protein
VDVGSPGLTNVGLEEGKPGVKSELGPEAKSMLGPGSSEANCRAGEAGPGELGAGQTKPIAAQAG